MELLAETLILAWHPNPASRTALAFEVHFASQPADSPRIKRLHA